MATYFGYQTWKMFHCFDESNDTNRQTLIFARDIGEAREIANTSEVMSKVPVEHRHFTHLKKQLWLYRYSKNCACCVDDVPRCKSCEQFVTSELTNGFCEHCTKELQNGFIG